MIIETLESNVFRREEKGLAAKVELALLERHETGGSKETTSVRR